MINKNIDVQIFYESSYKNLKSNRTIAITNKNMGLLKENSINIPKDLINFVDEISIYTENNKNTEILNFKNKKNLFFLIKNQNLLSIVKKSLKKVKFVKIKNQKFYQKLLNEKKQNLIINCEKNNFFNKKFFSKKFYKDYQSQAFTLIINHKSIKNNKATQIFTKFGPLAFLPLSKSKTSIVLSANKSKLEFTRKYIINLVKYYNKFITLKIFKY